MIGVSMKSKSRVDSAFKKKGFSLHPEYTDIIVGHSKKYWLSVNQELFPELSPGEMVEIVCLSDEVSCKKFDRLEKHPSREGILSSVWNVKGEKVTKTTGIKVRVGNISADCVIEVFGSEKEKYSNIDEFGFNHKKYTVKIEGKKTIKIFAPYPQIVSEAVSINVQSSNDKVKISGNRILKPKPDLGIAECKLRISSTEENATSVLTATIPNHECKADVNTVANLGMPIKIELDSGDMGNMRHMWRGSILLVAANHPSLKRYLGTPPEYSGQEDAHFKVLIAEIVSDAVVSLIMSRNQLYNPDEYEDHDWDAFYADYTKLMTDFLPIAHETQVSL